MAKKKLAKGDTLVCVPCGAEYLVTETGAAYAEAWCCGVPMQGRPAAAPKKPAAKPAARAAAPKKAPARKAAAKPRAAARKKR